MYGRNEAVPRYSKVGCEMALLARHYLDKKVQNIELILLIVLMPYRSHALFHLKRILNE